MSDNPHRDPRRRCALVGAGHRATTYIDALAGAHAGDGRLVALCDTNSTRMRYHADQWSQARPDDPPPSLWSDADFAALLERERPDAVIVTSVDSTHDRYIVEALERGCDVIVEKPLTTDAERCGRIVRAALRSDRELRVAFNYRYSPRNAKVKELVAAGAIGEVTSAHFEWVLDTVHGADYFRRWHRDKAQSGGLLVHKSSHHFDLVNWWLAAAPQTVFAMGALRFYGADGAVARRLAPGSPAGPAPPADAAAFEFDLAADEHLRRLYVDAQHEDGYVRNRGVFDEGITIEDNMGVLVAYDSGAVLSYSLNAHAPWEGYRVALNGTEGRLELDVCERAAVRRGSTARVLAGEPAPAEEDDAGGGSPGRDRRPAAPARQEGTRLVLQRHWSGAELIDVADGVGAHGGGDALLLDDLFRGARADPLGQRAGYLDGARSMLVGAAANRCLERGEPVTIAELGVPLDLIARTVSRRAARQELDRLLQSRSG